MHRTELCISLMRLMDGEGQEIKDEGEVNWEQLEQGGVQNTERLGIGWKNYPLVYLAIFKNQA